MEILIYILFLVLIINSYFIHRLAIKVDAMAKYLVSEVDYSEKEYGYFGWNIRKKK